MTPITPSYTITEPHPTVPQNSYTHSGRGGLGNFFRAPATTSPSGVPTPLTTIASNSSSASARPRAFYSGRGGAGNAHAAAERPVLSFDEEFTRAETRDKSATVGYMGRGGAGNYSSSKKKTGEDGSSMTRIDSASTAGSGSSSRSGFLGRIFSHSN